MDEEGIKELQEMGLKDRKGRIMDSKRLTYIEREFLREQIERRAKKIVVKEVTPHKIDEFVEKKRLNELEVKLIKEILDEIGNFCAEVIIDSPAASGGLKKKFKNYKVKLTIVNKADTKYPIVACSSIIAKVIRDEKIIKIFKQCKSIIGSGYPTKRVISYLKDYITKHKKVPPWVRKSWRPLKNINIT
jgi:ribonuclease H